MPLHTEQVQLKLFRVCIDSGSLLEALLVLDYLDHIAEKELSQSTKDYKQQSLLKARALVYYKNRMHQSCSRVLLEMKLHEESSRASSHGSAVLSSMFKSPTSTPKRSPKSPATRTIRSENSFSNHATTGVKVSSTVKSLYEKFVPSQAEIYKIRDS